MDNLNVDKLIKIKNEIKILLDTIDEQEEKLNKENWENLTKITLYKNYMENIISEFHDSCKRIYK